MPTTCRRCRACRGVRRPSRRSPRRWWVSRVSRSGSTARWRSTPRGSTPTPRWAPTSTATTSPGSGRSSHVAAERGYTGPVAWHFAGPISVGVALLRAGAPRRTSRSTSAASSCAAHIRAVAADRRRGPAGRRRSWSIIDEPFADDVMDRDFPTHARRGVDLLSSAMAAVEPVATVGVHCCGDVDASLLLAAGPHVVSLPVSTAIVAARRLRRPLPRRRRLDRVGRGRHRRADRRHRQSLVAPARLALARPRCSAGARRSGCASRACSRPSAGSARTACRSPNGSRHSLRDIGRAVRSDCHRRQARARG